MVNQCTKFEISSSPVTKLWMGVQNAENGVVRGHSRSSAMSPFDREHTTSCSTLIETMCRFRDIADYLSKVANFDPLHLHLAHPQGAISVEFRRDLWHQKTRVHGLSCGVVCVILRLAILVEHRLVTDRRTDRHRAIAYRPTADSLHRAVKTKKITNSQSPSLPWFSPCRPTVIFGHCRDFVSRTWILAYYMQFQFLKGRYCLSFAVLFHFGRVPVMHTVI